MNKHADIITFPGLLHPATYAGKGKKPFEDHAHGLSKTARSVTNRRIAMSLSNAAPENPGAGWTIPQSANALRLRR